MMPESARARACLTALCATQSSWSRTDASWRRAYLLRSAYRQGRVRLRCRGRRLLPGLMNLLVHLDLILPGAAGSTHAQQSDVWLVPTMVVSQPASFDFFERIGFPDWYIERLRAVATDHWAALQRAIEEGVKIAPGSEQHPFEPNDGTTATIREAEYYVQADIVAVTGNPLDDFTSLRSLDFVMKASTIFRNDWH